MADQNSVVSAGAPGSNLNPAIVRANEDRGIVAWENIDAAGTHSVFYRWTDDGGANWLPALGPFPQLDDTPGFSQVRQVDLAADIGGNAGVPQDDVVAVFHACRDADEVCGIFTRKSIDNGNTWSAPSLIPGTEGGTQPSIDASNFTWRLTYTSTECEDLHPLGYCEKNIWYAPSGEGVFWGVPIKLTNFEGEDRNSSIAFSIGGNALIAWGSDRRANSDFVSEPTIWFTSQLAPIDTNSPPAVPRLEHLPARNPMAGDEINILARVAMVVPGPPATGTPPVILKWTMNGRDMPDRDMEGGDDVVWHAGIGPFDRAGAEVGYRVMVMDVNGTMTSHRQGFRVQPRFHKRANVLLVLDDHNDERARGRAPFYGEALAAAGVRHDVWDSSRLGPPRPEVLRAYTHGAVVWTASDRESWLWNHPVNPDSARAALGSYLDHGGSLIISGQQIAEALMDRDPDWLRRYLRASFEEHAPAPGEVVGEGLLDGLGAVLEGEDSANNSYSPDIIHPEPGAGPIFRYGTLAAPDEVAAVWQRMGQRRVAFLAFNCEAIEGSATRDEVMNRLIHWANPTCNGRASTIDGTSGPDNLVGTPQRDVIIGFGGADTIWGLAGNDVICAGRGPDVVFGGEGGDWISGGPGLDMIVGGPGSDRIFGNTGPDLILGGDGNDSVDGGPDSDQLSGGNGDDLVTGRGGDDALFGNAGDDIVNGGNGTDLVDCGEGIDIGFGGFGPPHRHYGGLRAVGSVVRVRA